MLNKNNVRELVYIVKVDNINTMVGYDSLELATVNGWKCVVGKGSMKPGDLAVYFEIDSKLPDIEPFNLNPALVKYKFKIKTQRFGRGGIPYVSQGLLMPLSEFGDKLKNYKLGDFLTEKLGVTYYEAEDNARKADNSKYTSMRDRHKKFFKTKLGKWLMRRAWGRKLCFFFLGKKKDKKTDWPNWVIKTDEERCQNCFNQMKALNLKWMVTEKIDGTSSTFTMKNGKKKEMLVCSRNVVYNAPEKEERNYYKDSDGNVYLEMAATYKMREVLETILKDKSIEFITIQGETYGGSIQKRKYGEFHDLAIFNVIIKENGKAPKRLNPLEMIQYVEDLNTKYGFKLKCVPLVDPSYELPETIEELLEYAGSELSRIDKGMREGVVFRSEDGVHSFKAVDNNYLCIYHNN